MPGTTAAAAAAQMRDTRARDAAAALDAEIARRLAGDTATIGYALLDPASRLTLMRGADRRFHAASTMKVGVLVELVRRIDDREMAWDDSLIVQNRFASIVDGSAYALDPADDSDSTLYRLEGQPVSIRRLAELMIARSSNLATNLLIARLDARRVQATARALGADSIEIRRGVEDGKAYAAGLNNTTTARDLAALLDAVAGGQALSGPGTGEIRRILLLQEFNDGIPARLPEGVRVAHKTGEITGITHDAALVYPPGDTPPFVLVILTRGYPDRERASARIAELARISYDAVMSARPAHHPAGR